MGYKYEVNAYIMYGNGEYEYVQSYTGDSLLRALWDMWKCKNHGSGCVKLEWR